MMLRDHKRRKVTEPDFSGKFSFSQKWEKGAQNGPKIGFLDFDAKLIVETPIFSDNFYKTDMQTLLWH